MKKLILLLALCGVVAAGCSKTHSAHKPKGPSYETNQDAEAARLAIYKSMLDNLGSSSFRCLFNAMGDDIYVNGQDLDIDPELNELNSFRYTPDNHLIADAYKGLYSVINTANLAIDHLKDGLSGGIVTDTTQMVVAEAKGLRALCYLYLGMGWGTPPIVDHVLKSSEKPGNATSQDAVWEFIIKDIDEALPYLTERQGKDDREGTARMTQGVAYTIKGKALLWKKDYAKARDALENVIGSHNYDLAPGYEMEYFYHNAGIGNREKVFELNITNNQPNYSGDNLNWLWNWRSDYMILPLANGSVLFDTGGGAFNPSEKFINKFYENDRESYRLKASVKSFDDVIYYLPYPVDDASHDFKARDPNRGINAPEGLHAHCGWFMWKVIPWVQDFSSNNRTLLIFRYPEVLLMYAECALQRGDPDGAKPIINTLQERAGSCTVSESITMDVLKREKMYECWMEGLRFFDLVRWGDTRELADNGKSYPSFQDRFFFTDKEVEETGQSKTDIHTGYVNKNDAGWCLEKYPDLGFKEKHKLLPFPTSAIKANKNIVQNPGW